MRFINTPTVGFEQILSDSKLSLKRQRNIDVSHQTLQILFHSKTWEGPISQNWGKKIPKCQSRLLQEATDTVKIRMMKNEEFYSISSHGWWLHSCKWLLACILHRTMHLEGGTTGSTSTITLFWLLCSTAGLLHVYRSLNQSITA